MQTLQDLLKGTDALTFLNALKVTLTEIKSEITEQEALIEHLGDSHERTKKLMRRADNQYRLMVKLVQSGETSITTDIDVDDSLGYDAADELRELMESE